MTATRHNGHLRPWHIYALIVIELLFAACASSVLLYRAQGWAPEIIDFGWLSYRAWNIYLSLALVAYLVLGLLHGHRYVLPLLGLFALFHLLDGLLIGFWLKAVLQFAAVLVLLWGLYSKRCIASA